MTDADKYAPVLERMIDLLGAGGGTFGSALQQASAELGVEVPEDKQGPLLVSAFRIISGGRIPGAADA